MKIVFRLLVLLCIGSSLVHAQVPQLLEYDGFLPGNVSGNRTIGVRLYNASTNGTLLYKETIGTVKVTQGQFYFQYGQNGTLGNGTTPTTISAVLTGSQNWLGITVNGTEQSPRERLLPVPFALRSADAQALTEQVGTLSSNLTTVRGLTTSLSTNLGTLQTQSANMSSVIGTLGSNLTTLRNQNTALAANLTAVQNQLASLKEILPPALLATVTTFANLTNPGEIGGNPDFSGIALDKSGNVYVADGRNYRIRKITASGNVTTLAGSGNIGNADGSGTTASFNMLNGGIAVDSNGNVYVTDYNRIRKITASGNVTTLAGSENMGFANGQGTSARFSRPTGIAVDSNGNVYVTDRDNYRIRKITASGNVTTLAGSGNRGDANGSGTIASFRSPTGIAVDGNGNVYVTDQEGFCIRKITASGNVTALAGSTTGAYSIDGQGATASFISPSGIAVDSNGNVYVSDGSMGGGSSAKIRKISTSGNVTTLAGLGITNGAMNNYVDGSGTTATFGSPSGIALDASGNLYVMDGLRIRKITTLK